MAEVDEGGADWAFTIGEGPVAVLPEDAETALVEARAAVDGFVETAGVLQERARDAEALIVRAYAAGAGPSVLAVRLGLSYEAVQRIVRGEQHLIPDLV